MEAVVLIGLQASGKSSFYRDRFFRTHVRISLDLLKTRNREWHFLTTCLETGQKFVVDNTNPSPKDRERYIAPSVKAGFKTVGYYMASKIEDCYTRNRDRREAVPDVALRATLGRLKRPTRSEGFDELFYVCLSPTGFEVEEWRDEI
ncbi:MAG: AAA family ATPase [Planctomycetota bacterium]